MRATTGRSVPYHPQRNWFYCGAASALMVLESLGATELSQDDLYRQARDNSLERTLWRSPPDGIAWTLNTNRARDMESRFAIIAADDAESQARWLVWCLHRNRTPPIVLVEARMHWVVVCAYEASAAPASANDTSYRIDGFVVNDPWPPECVASSPQANRSHGGGTGRPNQYIAYSTWLEKYAMRVDVGRWKGKYVVISETAT